MEPLLAVVVGVLFSTAIYLMMQRNLVRIVIGVIILSNSVNLLIFTLGRLTRASAPLIPAGEYVPVEAIANPLPQALVLTAIVIGFGLFAFSLVLTYRTYKEIGTLDVDELREAETPYEKPSGKLDNHTDKEA
jgi:multicomponent Na+:H+ antiporter subunit C